jgi:hypothetical protein
MILVSNGNLENEGAEGGPEGNILLGQDGEKDTRIHLYYQETQR